VACIRYSSLALTLLLPAAMFVCSVLTSLLTSLDNHVSRICAGCYYRLRQLRRIRRSLDSDSLATLVYAAVSSRIDYCNAVLAGAPRTVIDKLQRVLNAAARVVTGTRKFDRGLDHWLDVPQRVFFKLAVSVHCCLNGRAPLYLSDPGRRC